MSELDEALYQLATFIAAYSNPHMFSDLKELPEVERMAELEALKSLMGEMIG